MGNDRDNRRVVTPPLGVRSQIAEPESWEDQSGGGTASTGVIAKPLGAAPETMIETVVRRSGETKNMLGELAPTIAKLETRIDAAHDKLDELYPVLGDLRVEVASHGGQNKLIIGMLDEQRNARERSGMMRMTSFSAEVEVGKTRALSEIQDVAASRALRRKLIETTVMRAIAGVGVLWAFISVTYLSRCGG